jgi:hypothetical protein
MHVAQLSTGSGRNLFIVRSYRELDGRDAFARQVNFDKFCGIAIHQPLDADVLGNICRINIAFDGLLGHHDRNTLDHDLFLSRHRTTGCTKQRDKNTGKPGPNRLKPQKNCVWHSQSTHQIHRLHDVAFRQG